jgi:hypothetical protein
MLGMVQASQCIDLAAEEHPMGSVGVGARDQLHRNLLACHVIGRLDHSGGTARAPWLRKNHVTVGYRTQHVAPLIDTDPKPYRPRARGQGQHSDRVNGDPCRHRALRHHVDLYRNIWPTSSTPVAAKRLT